MTKQTKRPSRLPLRPLLQRGHSGFGELANGPDPNHAAAQVQDGPSDIAGLQPRLAANASKTFRANEVQPQSLLGSPLREKLQQRRASPRPKVGRTVLPDRSACIFLAARPGFPGRGFFPDGSWPPCHRAFQLRA